MIHEHVSELIGDTPLLRIPAGVHGLTSVDVYAKLELRNPFGSVKDRIAWAMLRDDVDALARDGRTVIESSSGNTAKALRGLTSTFGIPFRTVTNRIKVEESRDLLELLGADVHELPGTSDCPDPNDPNDPFMIIQQEVEASGGRLHHTSQYTNERNVEAHHATGDEIVRDLGSVDYFVGGLGTTGSTRGVAERLRAANPDVEIVGVVAEPSDYIPGIRTADEMYEVGLYEPEVYAGVEQVSSGQAIEMTMRLVRQAGLFAGPTSGASLHGAVAYLRELDRVATRRTTAVFIACDRLEGYLSYVRTRRPDLFGGRLDPDGFRAFDHSTVPVPALTPDEAERWIRERGALVVDTRGGLAFATGHIAGSVNITDEALEFLLDGGIPFSDRTPVLLACPVGMRSRRYAAYLAARGVEAASLAGGIVAWRDAGLTLERSGSFERAGQASAAAMSGAAMSGAAGSRVVGG